MVSTTTTQVEPVPVMDGPVAYAYDEAVASREPRFVAASVHVDDRGWSIMNQLCDVLDPAGQINYAVMHPGVIKAWHRHAHQTDFWLCVAGHLKVGVHREEDGRAWQMVVGQMRPGVVVIPPPLWHGAATVGPQSAGLVYYVTRQYDARQPDEQRRPADALAGFVWAVEHR